MSHQSAYKTSLQGASCSKRLTSVRSIDCRILLSSIDNVIPRLAVRKGIAWATQAPIEDSDVLHICLPSGHFTDIRFAHETTPNAGVLWAFAGHSTFKKLPALATENNTVYDGWNQIVRGQFAHPIDSAGDFTNDYHSDIINLPSGGGDQLETGMLDESETGKFIIYKEYWTLPKDTTLFPCVRGVFEKEGGGHGLLKGQLIRVGDTGRAREW
ncbi:hypothetical protein IAT40_007373 [Kwoniella sp. CBS 6097]